VVVSVDIYRDISRIIKNYECFLALLDFELLVLGFYPTLRIWVVNYCSCE
jgi:hypothetical protein